MSPPPPPRPDEPERVSGLAPPPVSTLAPPPPPRPDRRWPGRRALRWIHLAGLAVVIPVGAVLGYAGAAAVVALFVVIVPFEKMFRRHDQRIRRPGLRTDLTYALVGTPLTAAGTVVAIAIAVILFPIYLPALLLRPIVTLQPIWLLVIEGFLLADISIYWAHRLHHEIGFLWRFHSVHHSSERMDWIAGIRQHPFDGFIIIGPVVFLIVAGFPVGAVGVFAVVQTILGLMAHANVRWRLRPLHRIVMTPEFHHWHHANHPESIHTNYSVFLPVWDIIWGTYRMPADLRPERYGIDEPMPDTVTAQLVHPFTRDVRERYPFPPAWRRMIGRLTRPLRRLVPFHRRVTPIS